MVQITLEGRMKGRDEEGRKSGYTLPNRNAIFKVLLLDKELQDE